MRQMKKSFEKYRPYIDIIKNQLKNNINSYDLETYEDDQKYIPYCACFTINNTPYWYYDKNVIINSILKIFSISTNSILYVHNLDFDGFLILEEVSKYKKLKINFLVYKMKLYYLKIKFANRSIEFRCSKKIIPARLNYIAESFNLPNKIKYPYKFINKNTINYKGELIYDKIS